MRVPATIAPEVRAVAGIKIFLSLLLRKCLGILRDGDKIDAIVRRKEYIIVRAVERSSKVRVSQLVGVNKEVSRIRSLE